MHLGELRGARADLLAARAAECNEEARGASSGGGKCSKQVREALSALKVALAAERARADDTAAAMAAGLRHLGGRAGNTGDGSSSPWQPSTTLPPAPCSSTPVGRAGAEQQEQECGVGVDEERTSKCALASLSPETLAAHDKTAGSISVDDAVALGVPRSMIMGVSEEMIEEAQRRGISCGRQSESEARLQSE